MKRFLPIGALCAVAWMGMVVHAMPIGARTLMWGHAIARQAAVDPPPMVCTVTFDANGGSVAEATRTVTSGAAVGALPAATRNGYELVGWFSAASGGAQITESAVVAGDVTYYAHWIASGGGGDGGNGGDSGTEKLLPTPVQAENAGTIPDLQFSKAQTVGGALFGANEIAGTVEVKISKGKNGVVSVSATATMLDTGKNVSAKAVKMTLDNGVLSGTLSFKAPIGDMKFAMDASGEFKLEGGKYAMSKADMSKGIRGKFLLDPDFALNVPGVLQTALLPWEFSFSASGSKWRFAKNATVKVSKDKATKEYRLVVDTGKKGEKSNLSSLKLTYKAKAGTFKGSFKAYALEEGKGGKLKLAKYTVNINGVVVDGIGYGRATVKKPASGPWAVVVE